MKLKEIDITSQNHREVYYKGALREINTAKLALRRTKHFLQGTGDGSGGPTIIDGIILKILEVEEVIKHRSS